MGVWNGDNTGRKTRGQKWHFPPPKWKKWGYENKYLLTFRFAISSIRLPTWPEKNPIWPEKIFISEINFPTYVVKQWLFWSFSHEKRGENPLLTGSLLFAIQIYKIFCRNPNRINIWIHFQIVQFAAICRTEASPCIILRGASGRLPLPERDGGWQTGGGHRWISW